MRHIVEETEVGVVRSGATRKLAAANVSPACVLPQVLPDVLHGLLFLRHAALLVQLHHRALLRLAAAAAGAPMYMSGERGSVH